MSENTMIVSPNRIIVLAMLFLSLSACDKHEEEHHVEEHKVIATTPLVKNVTITQQYVCQIHSQRHIEIRALERGYLEAIPVKEGQKVKAGDAIFTLLPVLYQTKLDAENAEAQLAQLEYNYTKKLFEDKVVSQNELLLLEAKLKRAKAKAEQAAAELGFSRIKAPYDGIIDRLQHQQGSLIEEGDILTTLSDNRVMWVYFNVPEARYLEYMEARGDQDDDHKKDDIKQDDKEKAQQSKLKAEDDLKIELRLANGNTFDQTGKIGAIEADFDNQTGNISFRADFPNPRSLLRHGQTGTVLIKRELDDAIVIPQRATFEILAKRYAYVIDDDNVVHQRDIVIQNELDDIYVIKEGLKATDKIILEGIRQVHDGEKVEFEFEPPEEVLGHLKYRAE